MAAAAQIHRHATLGFTIELSAGLDVDEGMPGVALVAAERADALPPGAFRANLTVVAEDVGEDVDLEGYLLGSLAEQERALEGFRLIDREQTELAGVPAVRTLAHHRARDALAVVAEQWRLVRGPRAWIVTCTSDAIGYAQTADVMAAAAESLAFDEAEAA